MLTKIRNEVLKITDILGYGWVLFKDNFRSIMLLNFIILIPVQVVYYVLARILTENTFFMQILENPGIVFESNFFNQYLNTAYYEQVVFCYVIMFLMQILFVPLSVAGTGLIVNRSLMTGKKMDHRNAIVYTFSKIVPLMLTSIVASSITIVAFTLLIPGVILYVYFVFCEFSVVLSQKSGFSALSYSYRLVKGRWFRSALYIVVLSLFKSVLTQLLGIFFFLPQFIISIFDISISALMAVFYSVWFINFEQLYKNQKLKKDMETI